MMDHAGTVSDNRKLNINQVKGKNCTGVCRRSCAQYVPHICVLLEDKSGCGHRVCQYAKSEETLVWRDDHDSNTSVIFRQTWFSAQQGQDYLSFSVVNPISVFCFFNRT